MSFVANSFGALVGRLSRFPPLTLTFFLRHRAPEPYRLSRGRTWLHRAADALPPSLREIYAETFLRRGDAPGPAAEHAFQYRLSATRTKGAREAKVAKGADLFYRRQYRQFLNPTMGAFAATATCATLGAGVRGAVRMAMAQQFADAPPILVLDHYSVATALYLPALAGDEGAAALARWLTGRGPMPPSYRRLVRGDDMRCAERGVSARRQSASGAALAVADAAIRSRKLALLALHPHDPDAMGLHITLFGVDVLGPRRLARDYGLDPTLLDPWRRAAHAQGALLCFLAGGVEEAFTQCSQNLFVKRPCASPDAARRAAWPNAWSPGQPLERLISGQFEILQATVSASGLPGVSPRNGDVGLAGFVVRREGRRPRLLIPYFTGNAVHGHAAKLWSNPSGALMVWDDHTALCAVTLTGPCRTVSHERVVARAPAIAARIATRRTRNGGPADPPEYWFEQEVADMLLQDEPLAANMLDPARPACAIHAAGPAMHGKKPAYFDAEASAPYDMAWQHERERKGRPTDPTGAARRHWVEQSAPAFAARETHLAALDIY